MVQSLQSTMNNMTPSWDGMTAQRFYGDYKNWHSSMPQFDQPLSQINQELHAIADRFAAADYEKGKLPSIHAM